MLKLRDLSIEALTYALSEVQSLSASLCCGITLGLTLKKTDRQHLYSFVQVLTIYSIVQPFIEKPVP